MKKPVRIIMLLLVFAATFFAAVVLVTQMAENSTLKDVYENQIKGKKIASIEYVKYESEPFMSVVLDRRYTDKTSSEAFKTIKNVNRLKVNAMFNRADSNEVLLVKFKDKSELTCYLDGSKLGLDSGRVWVKGINRVKLIRDMKKVNLVKSM